jgi:predicted aspartyl protease
MTRYKGRIIWAFVALLLAVGGGRLIFADRSADPPLSEAGAGWEVVGDDVPEVDAPAAMRDPATEPAVTLVTQDGAEDTTPAAAEVIAQQQTAIDALKAEVAGLESQLSELQSRDQSEKEAALAAFMQERWEKEGNLGFLTTLGYVQTPLLRKAGYFEVKLRMNGDNAYFLLDTGASVSIMDETLSRTFKVRRVDLDTPRQYVGLGGKSESAQKAVVESLEIEDMALKDAEFPLVDLGHVNDILEKSGQYPVHGLLGDDFLEAHRAIIDIEHGVAYFHP